MTDQGLYDEVITLLDDLRDDASDLAPWVNGRAWRMQLLLVGDDGLLRRLARRAGDDLASIQAWVKADANQTLLDLRDTLRAMRDAT